MSEMRGVGYVTPFTSSEAFSMANFNSRIDEMNNGINEVAQAVALAGLTITTLWTNPYPGNQMDRTTVTLTTSIPSDTKFLAATFIPTSSALSASSIVTTAIALYTPNYVTTLTGIYLWGHEEYAGFRRLNFTNNTTFTPSSGSLGGDVNNLYMIPINIYAIK